MNTKNTKFLLLILLCLVFIAFIAGVVRRQGLYNSRPDSLINDYPDEYSERDTSTNEAESLDYPNTVNTITIPAPVMEESVGRSEVGE